MNLRRIILKELLERKKQFLTSFIAILLGIIVIVAVKSVSNSSEKAIAIQLDNLGANILILPQTATIDNYYAADINAPEMPEEYVERIASSTIKGVDNMSPKLSARMNIQEHSFVLTGILPKNELASKPIWQTSGFADPGLQAACDPNNIMNTSHGYEDPRLQRKVIDSLGEYDCLAGSDVASKLKLKEGSPLQIKGTEFKVASILPQTGTVDDGRIFVHLRTAQRILGKEKVINAIEIMGCCSAISRASDTLNQSNDSIPSMSKPGNGPSWVTLYRCMKALTPSFGDSLPRYSDLALMPSSSFIPRIAAWS